MARLMNLGRVVMMGAPVYWNGQLHVITGYDSDKDSVWLGRDETIVRVTPDGIGMTWDTSGDSPPQEIQIGMARKWDA